MRAAHPERLLLIGVTIAAALSPGVTAAASAAVTATFSPATGTLSVAGTDQDDTIVISRDIAGALFVNGGAVAIVGGTPTAGTTSLIEVFGRSGDDHISLDEANGPLPAAHLFGGAGDDVLTGGSGADQLFGEAGDDTLLGKGGDDQLFGGPGKDTLIGGTGADLMDGGDGDDVAVWNPGEGSDVVEGQKGTDTLRFNGANISETVDVSANGPRVRFFRNVANITMDLDGVERIEFNALGGADAITVNDLAGTDAQVVALDLAGTLGGASGDGQADTVVVNATNKDDKVSVAESTGTVTVTGLAARVEVNHAEAAQDTLQINSLDGNDTVEVNGDDAAEVFTATANGTRVRFDRISPAPFSLDIGTTEHLVVNANGGDDSFSATGNLADLIQITVDGGPGNDTLRGGNGADVLIGGDGNDSIDGNQGNDTLIGGKGDDVFIWDPGDGSDTIDGQAGNDTLRFNGANIGEAIDISANGKRVRFFRNVANITMDLDGVERIEFNALGGSDQITVNSLAGTDAQVVALDLASTLGGASGDGQADTVVVNGTAKNDNVTIAANGGAVTVTGLAALVEVSHADAALDSLLVKGLDGNDTVTAKNLPAGVINLTIDGGTGNDRLTGSAGDDTLDGGPGTDTLDGGAGTDTALNGETLINIP